MTSEIKVPQIFEKEIGGKYYLQKTYVSNIIYFTVIWWCMTCIDILLRDNFLTASLQIWDQIYVYIFLMSRADKNSKADQGIFSFNQVSNKKIWTCNK